MNDLVFFCKNCKQTFAGEDYQASDKPHCPKCNKKMLCIGITKEVWVQKTKEERQTVLATLVKEETQRAQSIAKREEYAQSVGVTYNEKEKDTTNSLDDLYIDIGKKIKGWAKWIFIVETIASIIGAIIMIFAAEDSGMMIVGLLTFIVGPLLAWVSSWILYAFGELVDKTTANEQNTRNILKIMLENNAQKEMD